MTWSFAHKIEVRDSRKGVFLDMLIKPAYRKQLLETMEDLGYKKISENTEFIGEVFALEHDELEDITELVLEY